MIQIRVFIRLYHNLIKYHPWEYAIKMDFFEDFVEDIIVDVAIVEAEICMDMNPGLNMF